MTWRRADLGDVPEVDAEIVAVVYPAEISGSMLVYSRMRVAAVLQHPTGVRVVGGALPDTDGLNRFTSPPRPTDIVGKRGFLWNPYPYVEE